MFSGHSSVLKLSEKKHHAAWCNWTFPNVWLTLCFPVLAVKCFMNLEIDMTIAYQIKRKLLLTNHGINNSGNCLNSKQLHCVTVVVL